MTDLQKRISEKVRQLSPSCGQLGFRYIKTAVELVYNDETYLREVTKRFYPEIAKIHGTTPANVDRAIRHFVESVFTRNGVAAIEVLGGPPDMNSGRLTNTNFIAALVEALRCEE